MNQVVIAPFFPHIFQNCRQCFSLFPPYKWAIFNVNDFRIYVNLVQPIHSDAMECVNIILALVFALISVISLLCCKFVCGRNLKSVDEASAAFWFEGLKVL